MAHPIRLVALTCALVACTPSIDWRDLHPEGIQLALAMPCRPSRTTRTLMLAEQPVQMTQLTCTEREMTFAVGAADVLDPARVGAALEALSTAMVSNLHGRIESTQSAQVAGMTPQPSARHVRIVGRRPDGAVAMVELTVFAFGTRVYQAALLGERLDPDLTRTFFASLRVTP